MCNMIISLLSSINQTACSIIDWVVNSQSVFGWVVHWFEYRHWKLTINKNTTPATLACWNNVINFRCADGECIPNSWVCDGEYDCDYWTYEEEDDCAVPSTTDCEWFSPFIPFDRFRPDQGRVFWKIWRPSTSTLKLGILCKTAKGPCEFWLDNSNRLVLDAQQWPQISSV